MPIHDQGYRRYTGTRLPHSRTWRAIARSGVQSMLRRRAFVALIIVSWLPFIVRAVQLYAAANLPQVPFLAPTAETFRQFLGQQETFLFFVTVYAGAGLIANDRRVNALQIYLSRPLTRMDYILGKLAALLALVLFVTWVPAVLLVAVQVLFSGSSAFVLENMRVLPAITVLTGFEAVIVSLAMLALSSLSKSSRFVGILYAALLFFTQAITVVLRAVMGERGLAWLSVTDSLTQVGDAIFGLPLLYESSVLLCFVSLLAIAAVSVAVLNRRVRGVEVVA